MDGNCYPFIIRIQSVACLQPCLWEVSSVKSPAAGDAGFVVDSSHSAQSIISIGDPRFGAAVRVLRGTPHRALYTDQGISDEMMPFRQGLLLFARTCYLGADCPFNRC